MKNIYGVDIGEVKRKYLTYILNYAITSLLSGQSKITLKVLILEQEVNIKEEEGFMQKVLKVFTNGLTKT